MAGPLTTVWEVYNRGVLPSKVQSPVWIVAISAFGLLRTVNEAWYAGVQASSSTRLVARSAISLTFNLPLAYAQRVKAVDGVSSVSWAVVLLNDGSSCGAEMAALIPRKYCLYEPLPW